MDARQEFMKVAEIAQELRIARSRAYDYELLAADRTIPAVKIGRSVRLRRTERERWLEGQRCPNYKALTAEVRNVR
jgi:excisionase family DNA binding protein